MSPPAGPVTPWVWLVGGLVLDFIGASVYFTGRDTRDDSSIAPLIGTIFLSVGGFLVLVGATGIGALVALRRHAWEQQQRDPSSG